MNHFLTLGSNKRLNAVQVGSVTVSYGEAASSQLTGEGKYERESIRASGTAPTRSAQGLKLIKQLGAACMGFVAPM